MSAGNSILAKASIPVIFTSSMVMVSSSHKAWLQGTTPAPTTFRADAVPVPTSFRTVATFTSSQWASASVPTSWILFCRGLDLPFCWGWHCPVVPCRLLVVRHLRCQCPIFPHAPHLAALAGQEACPGVCCTVQLPHECCCCGCCCCCGLCRLLMGPFRVGPFWIAWTVLELPRPMASLSLPQMGNCSDQPVSLGSQPTCRVILLAGYGSPLVCKSCSESRSHGPLLIVGALGIHSPFSSDLLHLHQ